MFALLFGIVLGMRHALEPDHLAAVSTLVTDTRRRVPPALLGAVWGVGHTASLLGVGFVLALVKAELSARLANAFELCVAVMLIVLGVRALWRARLGAHVHTGPSDHVHIGRLTITGQPFVIGLVHGLAGSGALTALVLAELPTTSSRLIYMGLFGLGSALGMALLTGLVGLPLARLAKRPRALQIVSIIAGVGAISFGLFWGSAAVIGVAS